jgi:hypothetical protein
MPGERPAQAGQQDRHPARAAADIGDEVVAVGPHQLRERGEQRTVDRPVVQI